MTITDLNTLVKEIHTLDVESQACYIKAYADSFSKNMYEQGYSKGYRDCVADQKKIRNKRNDRIKNTILNYDEENGYIELVDFTKFFFAVENELKTTMKHDEQARSYAENLHDFLWQLLGKIKTDRRFLFRKDE